MGKRGKTNKQLSDTGEYCAAQSGHRISDLRCDTSSAYLPPSRTQGGSLWGGAQHWGTAGWHSFRVHHGPGMEVGSINWVERSMQGAFGGMLYCG